MFSVYATDQRLVDRVDLTTAREYTIFASYETLFGERVGHEETGEQDRSLQVFSLKVKQTFWSDNPASGCHLSSHLLVILLLD
jgi:hypothetical protein